MIAFWLMAKSVNLLNYQNGSCFQGTQVIYFLFNNKKNSYFNMEVIWQTNNAKQGVHECKLFRSWFIISNKFLSLRILPNFRDYMPPLITRVHTMYSMQMRYPEERDFLTSLTVQVPKFQRPKNIKYTFLCTDIFYYI